MADGEILKKPTGKSAAIVREGFGLGAAAGLGIA